MITASVDERDIYRGIVGFARAMDARDWAAIERIAVPDATADLGTGRLESRAEMIALMRSFLDECGPTQHLVSNVLIDVDTEAGGETAHSRAYVSDLHLGTGALTGLSFQTLGDYHDEWAKVDGEWRMTHRTKSMRGTLGTQAVLGAGPDGYDASGPAASGDAAAGGSAATEITNLLYRYAECMDSGRLDDASELFRHATIHAGKRELDAAGILAVWRGTVRLHDDGTPRTKHVISNPILEIDEQEGRARARSYYTVLQATAGLPLQVIAAGRYHDEFERSGGTWRFRSRDYSMLDLTGDMHDHLRSGGS
ncbi:nuclear transport factor 2 family protein [Tomitella gaofuii]|uniref:nuclear transport factor 2 family protein n=1 Tax=Tomitella gaofuii TaxID=2760083 RepID=UPI002E2B0CC1|nr:nuclear transport factor 2 family protein [Tomitella gaofuii]